MCIRDRGGRDEKGAMARPTTVITLPFNSGILGLRMGPYVPTPKFFTISGDPGRVIYQIIDMSKFTFSLKSVFIVDVRFELTTNDPWSVDDAICEGH